LSYNNARDYDTSIGRYAEADPLGFGGGPNLYSYASQSPTQVIDPNGQNPFFFVGALMFLAYEFTPQPANAPGLNDQVIPESPAAPLENAVAVGTLGCPGVAKGATSVFGQDSYLFARGNGLLNSNDYFRIGWGWSGDALTGRDVFRIGIGNKDSFIHWHFDL